MLTCIDHVGIACRDLAAKIAFYESTFGLTVVSQETNDEQGVKEAMLAVGATASEAMLAVGATASEAMPVTGAKASGPSTPQPSYIQLLEPLGPDTPVGRFLERRGEGVHHVGYRVADIEAALASIGAAGVRLLNARPRHGSMGAAIAFLHPGDVGGVLTELVQPASADPPNN